MYKLIIITIALSLSGCSTMGNLILRQNKVR